MSEIRHVLDLRIQNMNGSPTVLGDVPISSRFSRAVLMPIGAIHFERDARVGQQEVHAVTPKRGFLHKRDAHILKGLTDTRLKKILTTEAAITRETAKLAARTRLYTNGLPALPTFPDLWRAAAILTAVVPVQVSLCHKRLTATVARLVLGKRRAASAAAEVVAIGLTRQNSEPLSALWANLIHSRGGGKLACFRAVSLLLGRTAGHKVELPPALRACSIDAAALALGATKLERFPCCRQWRTSAE